MRDAILHLRDVLGATDPEAGRAGQFLWDNEYHTDCCLVRKVPLGQNPKKYYACNPPGTHDIIIYEDFLTYRYSRDLLAMILYAEWCHIDDPGFGKEDTQQQKLIQFREAHGFQTLAPEVKHGAPEGSAD